MRVAFIGLGHAAQWLHLPAARAVPGTVTVGGADPSPERRREWAELAAGPTFADATELLERAAPDVVVVATPPDSHASLCLAALEGGAHVLCEKPFVETLDQADSVLAAAAAAGRSVAVNHEFRYMPIFRAVPGVFGSPEFGRPVFLHATQFMDLPPWKEKVAWRAAMPDRALFEGGVHIVDLIYSYVGRLPQRVFAATSAGLDLSRKADAIHLVTLDFGEGVLAQITIDRLCPAGTRYIDLRIDGEFASVRASHGGRALVQVGVKRAQKPGIRIDFGPEGLAWLERGLGRRVLARNGRNTPVQATAALYAEAFGAFERGAEPPVSARTAREVLAIIEACYRSARTGQPVALEVVPAMSSGSEKEVT